jgi:hypothetical protein
MATKRKGGKKAVKQAPSPHVDKKKKAGVKKPPKKKGPAKKAPSPHVD